MSNHDTTQATLLENLRDGSDPSAWDEFFARYWPLIYGSARRRGCSEHTAEEVVQEVMLKVFRHRDVFRYDPQRGRFRDWLGKLVRSQLAEHRRRPSERVRARGGDSDPGVEELEADAAQADAAWETAFENALAAVLLDVVRRETDPRTYLAFELSALQGLAGGEVARITGLTRNAVYKARKRVLERLTQLGGPYRDEGQLQRQLKQAMESRPAAAVERALCTRIEETMRSK